MTQLTWNFQDVYTKVSEFLGLGSSPTGTNLALVKDIVYRGYLAFLFPVRSDTGDCHIWSFLKKEATLTTQEGQWRYPLPQDYRELVDVIVYDSDQNGPPIQKVPMSQIRSLRSGISSESYPSRCGVTWGRYDIEKGHGKDICFYPTPNGTYNLKYEYVFSPPKPVNDTDMFIGGPEASEVILQCSLAVAEFQEDEVLGVQNQKAAEMVAKLIRMDEGDTADTVGMVYDAGLVAFSPWAYKRAWGPTTSVSEAYGYGI